MGVSLQTDKLLLTAIDFAIKAGDAALDVYNCADFEVEEKADHTPLTLADRRAHDIITAGLEHFDIPVLSEEGKDIQWERRREWPLLWIVDPLDGTKEFVKKNGEFTINIALTKEHRPILGVIYVPVTGRLYFAADTYGAYAIDRTDMPAGRRDDLQRLIAEASKLPFEKNPMRPYTIMGSRSHATPELGVFVEKMRALYGSVDFVSAGSSLKFCRVAEGYADIYPRMGPTMEWDTAAGQAIAEQAGAAVYDYHTRTSLTYNKAQLENPWFVVERT